MLNKTLSKGRLKSFATTASMFLFSGFSWCSGVINAGEPFVAPAPEDLIIYHVFLDRFNDGNPLNNDGNPRGAYDPAAGQGWHGGDLKGAMDKLDYIKGLGANGIWLSPFVEGQRDYHGYAAYNWYNVDPNFGTLQDLRDFVDAANARGIAVYYDMVAGHMGFLLTSNDQGYPGYRTPPNQYTMRYNSNLRYPAPFNDITLFHAQGHIGNYFGEEQEKGELSDLDDLKSETPQVQDLMGDVWEYWLTETNVSGFRIDTVKHVDLPFWRVFLPRLQDKATELGRANYFTFGEIYGADDAYMSEYIGTLTGTPYKLDAAVDFQFYYASQGVFQRANRPPSDLSFRMQSRQQTLGVHSLKMPNFLDNHDLPRFLNSAQGNPGSGFAEQLRRLELGLIAMFMLPGPPVVYYGTEQNFSGGNDPQNREDMFDGQYEFGPSLGDNFNESTSTYELIARLSLLRNSLAPLRRGTFEPHVVAQNNPGIWAFSRAFEGDRVVVVLNTSTNNSTPVNFTIASLAGQSMTDALNPANTFTVPTNGQFSFSSIQGQGASVWVNTEDVPALPLAVAATNPVNGEIGVSINLPSISASFTQPMNQQVTNGAFSVTPSVPYTISWDQTGNVASLNLTAALFPESTYNVTISTLAQSLAGDTLDTSFTSTWTTERLPRALPPLPSSAGTLRPLTGTIVVDGNATEWPNTTSLARNQSHFLPNNFYVWNDALGDDTGPGSYLYPTNANFTQGDADIARLGVAFDETNFYFLLEQQDINPNASFFTTYYGIGIDLGINGRERIGFDQSTFESGIADLLVRPDADVDREIVFTGPRGTTLLNETGTELIGSFDGFSQDDGTIEISVPRSLLGLAAPLENRTIYLYAYTGLETFGGLREINETTADYEAGGGITSPTDPDVFDLVGASTTQQEFDLFDFTDQFETTIGYSLIKLTLSDSEEEAATTQWMLQ